MGKRALLFVASFVFIGSVASADIIYDVTVNTSSITGTTGSLDFNFNPGPLVTQITNLQILNFTGGSFQNCAANVQGFCNTGDATGTLPGTLTFDNGTGFNDYFTGFTYGSSLSFLVDLSGPGITSPNPAMYTSGSTFAFSMFSDAAGTIPVLTTDTSDGFAATINVNLDGSTTVTDFSTETTVVPATSTVPEPCSLGLVGAAAAFMGSLLRIKKPTIPAGQRAKNRMLPLL